MIGEIKERKKLLKLLRRNGIIEGNKRKVRKLNDEGRIVIKEIGVDEKK